MEKKLKKKNIEGEEVEEDLLSVYSNELEELLYRYPDDPNKLDDVNDEKLNKLIDDFDDNWMSFKKKWQNKFKTSKTVSVFTKVKKDEKGIRHLVIKNEFTGEDVLDLTIPDRDDRK